MTSLACSFFMIMIMAMTNIMTMFMMINLSTMLIASIAAPGLANVRELGQYTLTAHLTVHLTVHLDSTLNSTLLGFKNDRRNYAPTKGNQDVPKMSWKESYIERIIEINMG